MARSVPYPGARVIDISRRGAKGIEHFAADLAEPAEWDRVAELFATEIKGFAGERVVFVHSAGTLDPIGFAGEVDAPAYTREVLLNSAAPQVLGDAFLRAAAATAAPCTLSARHLGCGELASTKDGPPTAPARRPSISGCAPRAPSRSGAAGGAACSRSRRA